MLMGPIVYIKHLTSEPRLPFTLVYFGSIGLTLFMAIGVSLPPLPSLLHCMALVSLLSATPSKNVLTDRVDLLMWETYMKRSADKSFP